MLLFQVMLKEASLNTAMHLTDWSNVSRTISNYSTSLSVQNGTDSPVTNEMVSFYANFTKDGGFGIPGIKMK